MVRTQQQKQRQSWPSIFQFISPHIHPIFSLINSPITVCLCFWLAHPHPPSLSLSLMIRELFFNLSAHKHHLLQSQLNTTRPLSYFLLPTHSCLCRSPAYRENQGLPYFYLLLTLYSLSLLSPSHSLPLTYIIPPSLPCCFSLQEKAKKHISPQLLLLWFFRISLLSLFLSLGFSGWGSLESHFVSFKSSNFSNICVLFSKITSWFCLSCFYTPYLCAKLDLVWGSRVYHW